MGKFEKTHIFANFCTFWTIFIHFEATSDFSNKIISIQGTVVTKLYLKLHFERTLLKKVLLQKANKYFAIIFREFCSKTDFLRSEQKTLSKRILKPFLKSVLGRAIGTSLLIFYLEWCNDATDKKLLTQNIFHDHSELGKNLACY